MQFVSRPAGLMFLIAVTLLSIVAFILACGPTAPDPQGDTSNPTVKPTPAPTATPELIYVHIKGTLTPIEAPPTPMPGAAVPYTLRMNAERYLATREAQQAQGVRSADPQPTHEVFIYLSADDHITAVAQMLEASGSVIYNTEIGTEHYRPYVYALVPVSLFLEVEADERIKLVEQMTPIIPNNLPSTPSSQSFPVPVQNWHAAGHKARGVQVGIIDQGFIDFTASLGSRLIATPIVLCFSSSNSAPTNDIRDCEASTDHGTSVAREFLDVAPDATLYIAKITNQAQTKQAVDWMTAKLLDNPENQSSQPYDFGPAPQYNTTQNDNFDVKVITQSMSALWDGPGDGNSAMPDPDRYSLILSADAAIANGALWVNAAGNSALQTWFSQSPTYAGDYIDFDETATTDTCNAVDLTEGQKYTIQLRWRGSWPGLNKNLDLLLYNPAPPIGPPSMAGASLTIQSGDATKNPHELIQNTASQTGNHCIYVRRATPADQPEWIQLQVFRPDGATLSHIVDGGAGSIQNPAESDNPGLLSIGYATFGGLIISSSSSRGPVPEPHPDGRVAPSLATTASMRATSFSAPRVAGLAALLLGRFPHYTTEDLTYFIAANAHQRGDPVTDPDPNNEWGHGLARLPSPDTYPAKTSGIISLGYPGTITLGWPDTQDALGFIVEQWDGRIQADGSHRGWRQLPFTETGPDGYRQPFYIDTTANIATVSNLFSHVTYAHRVRSANGSLHADTAPFVATRARIPLPTTPTNLVGEGLDLSIRLTWDPVEHATSYEVQQWDGRTQSNGNFIGWRILPFTEIAPGFERTFTVAVQGETAVVGNSLASITYAHRIRAVNSSGQSEWTQLVVTTTLPPTSPRTDDTDPSKPNPAPTPTASPPAGQTNHQARTHIQPTVTPPPPSLTPTGLTTEVSGTRIYLSWDPGDNTNYVHQLVRRRKAGQTPLVWTDFQIPTHAATYTDTTALPGITYIYRVMAVKNNGLGADTNAAEISIPLPPKMPPSALEGIVSGTTVNLTWTAHTNPNYVTQIVRRRIAGVNPLSWTDFPVGVNDTKYSDTTAVSGTTYVYRIYALKANGEGSVSNAITVQVP